MHERQRPRDLAVGVPACFVAGVLVGTIGTFKHQVGISGAGLPVGLVLAVLMVAAVLAALRLAFPVRAYALAAGLGVVAAGIAFLFPGPSGSQIVIANPAGEVWAVAPAVVTAVVVGWPRRFRRTQRADGILDTGRDEGRLG